MNHTRRFYAAAQKPEGAALRRLDRSSASHDNQMTQAQSRPTSAASRFVVQAKLQISHPGDAEELEADRIGSEVLAASPSASAPSSGLPVNKSRRKNAPGGGVAIPPAVEERIHALHGGGQPLAPAIRAFFEPRFHADFGNVRIHTDQPSAELASALGARAFTSGPNIAFDAGQFAPDTDAGQRLLAHELTHVVQQNQHASLAADVTSVHRDADKPKPVNLDQALATNDSDELTPFRPFVGITSMQLLSLVNLIVTQKWVSWSEESMLEEAWRSRGYGPTLTSADYHLWKSCVNRGAELKNVFWLREQLWQFEIDVRQRAKDNLKKNRATIEAESTRLGIALGLPAASKTTPEADAAVARLQEIAQWINATKATLSNLGSIEVGYAEPLRTAQSDPAELGGAARPGGVDDALARGVERPRVRFNPDPAMAPRFPSEPGDGMATYEEVADTHQKLTGVIVRTLNRHPALYAMMAVDANQPLERGGSDALATQGQSVAEGRKKIAEALNEVMQNIEQTRIAIDERSLGFEAMSPVHDQLYASHPVYSNAFMHEAAQDYVADRGGDAAAGAAIVSAAAMALIVAVEIGSAGAATPLVGALISLTASGAAAADSWQRWATLDTGARSSVSDEGSIIKQDAADAALKAAWLDTATALLDVYGVGKAARSSASVAKVANFEAKLVLEKEIKNALPQLAEKSAAEATTLVKQSIDTIGPLQTLQRGGGWTKVEQAVASDKSVLSQLNAARTSVIERAEEAAAKAVGSDGKAVARAALAEECNVATDVVETLLGVVIMAIDESTSEDGSSLTAEGDFVHQTLNLERAAVDTLARNPAAGSTPVQRETHLAAPLSQTEAALDMLNGDQFETVIRSAINSGHFRDQGLPRMAVLEMKLNASGHGLDGVGLSRQGDLVKVYKFEFKQVRSGSTHVPHLGQTSIGTQGGVGWSHGNFERLLAADNDVAQQTVELLEKKLRGLFPGRYSKSLLLDAFGHELARAPSFVFTRAHANLEALLPQMRGLARWLGKGNTHLILIRGRGRR